jgi:hypothetical protein
MVIGQMLIFCSMANCHEGVPNYLGRYLDLPFVSQHLGMSVFNLPNTLFA